MIKAVAFLGNKGKEYEQTRHNAGWLLLEQFVQSGPADWKQKFNGVYTIYTAGSTSLYLLKPETYMNESGKSVGALMNFYKLQAKELLVVHDDLELEYGWIGFKVGGGLAGHNGLRSIAQALGTENFCRFRLGIGRPQHGTVASYVLARFSKEEEVMLPLVLTKAAECLKDLVADKIDEPEKAYKKFQII